MLRNKHHKIQSILLLMLIFSLSFMAIFKSDQKTSAAERRPLAQVPDANWADVSSATWMQSFDKYSVDQFPFRENFRSLKGFIEIHLFQNGSNNEVFESEGHLSEIDYPLNEASLEHASAVINKIMDTQIKGSDANVFFSIIPDKNYYIKDTSILTYDYDSLFSYMEESLSFASYIDITSSLDLSSYYTSDIHWRQEEITRTANLLLNAMSNRDLDPSIFTPKVHIEDFQGVYTGRYALPFPDETIHYVELDHFDTLTVYDHENNEEISMYREDTTQNQDPYSFFLHGPLSLITITNEDAISDKELVIFRDSFTSSLAPLLTNSYQKITLIDIRYLSSHLLPGLITFDSQDVLFLYSTSILNNSSQLR